MLLSAWQTAPVTELEVLAAAEAMSEETIANLENFGSVNEGRREEMEAKLREIEEMRAREPDVEEMVGLFVRIAWPFSGEEGVEENKKIGA